MGMYPFKRTDRKQTIYLRIARKIQNTEQLNAAALDLPPYAREQFVREIIPYLSFTPGQLTGIDSTASPSESG
jgi:hypothetical protein